MEAQQLLQRAILVQQEYLQHATLQSTKTSMLNDWRTA